MAQVYDPQYGTQSTVSSGIYYAFMVLIFFASNSHLRLLALFYQSVQLIPFGKVTFNPMLVHVITAGFCQGILTGMQFAFPMIAIELVSELAMGILMRIIPQINVFTVNFQVKIIMGLLMMLLLFSPMADYIDTIFTYMYQMMWTEWPGENRTAYRQKAAGCQKRRKYLPKQGCSYRSDLGWHIFRDPHMASFYIWTDEKLYDLGHRWSSPVLRRYAFSQPCFCYTVCVFKMCASSVAFSPFTRNCGAWSTNTF